MPDWQRFIREKLADAAISGIERENLIAELANHLEDLHAELLASGIAEPEASAQCRKQLIDIHQIAAAKRSQIWEGGMNQRTRTVWLPGLITLTMASGSLALMQLFAFSRPRVDWFERGTDVIGVLWLLLLVPCGALGAYLSRRGGGSRCNSIVASLFPSLTMFAVFCLVLPIAIFFEGNAYIVHHPRYFGWGLLFWTVIPGVSLFLGALPVLGKWNTQNHARTDRPQTSG